MSTDKFSKEQFEDALTTMSKEKIKLWEYEGMIKGEHCYTIPVMLRGKLTNKRVYVRSSIGRDGFAADAGEDSIRVWPEYIHKGTWRPMSKVKQRWVARTVNWRTNLQKWLRETYRAAAEDSNRRANGIREATGQGRSAAKTAIKMVKCPSCGASMTLKTYNPRRHRREFEPFYGCSGYPKCRTTMSIAQHDAMLAKLNGQAPKRPAVEFEPSHYQEAFRDFIQSGEGNCVLIAGPGTGKSTTALWALSFIPQELKSAYVAFNKDIVKEFAARAPRARVSTINSLGNGNIKGAIEGARFNGNKLSDILFEMTSKEKVMATREILKVSRVAIIKIVGLLKANLLAPTAENISSVCDKYSIELNSHTDLITRYATDLYEASVVSFTVYDYDDQVFACATGAVPCEKFDILICDEAQDMTIAQAHMAKRSLTEKGRFFAVGDPFQAVYGFRGADTQSISNIIDLFDATVLPLMLSYRLPKSHVDKINKRFGTSLEATTDAVEGIWREDVSQEEMSTMWAPGDMVLCRCNAPLIKPAFDLIKHGIKAIILGRDIGDGLVSLIKKVKRQSGATTLMEFLFQLDRWSRLEIRRLEKQEKTGQAQRLEDKVSTIEVVAEQDCETVYDVIQAITGLFADKRDGVTFSSIHKAKGQEAMRVFILKAQLMPHPRAQGEWELEQEEHIEFVGKTRSKSSMYISYQ